MSRGGNFDPEGSAGDWKSEIPPHKTREEAIKDLAYMMFDQVDTGDLQGSDAQQLAFERLSDKTHEYDPFISIEEVIQKALELGLVVPKE